MTTNVLLFTSQGMSKGVIDFLMESADFSITAVVTQYTDRDEIYGYPNPITYCKELGLNILQPRLLDEAFLEVASKLQPDLMINAYYPKIFSKKLIAIPKLGVINVHPGLLPEYRGTFPSPWQILNGEKEFGVTVHCLDALVDTGPILTQETFPIGEHETGFELYTRAMYEAERLLIKTLPLYVSGDIKPRDQAMGGSYYNQIEPYFKLDWHVPREILQRQVRVHAPPYFPAYCFLLNKMLLINKVSIYDESDRPAQGAGVIKEVLSDNRFIVSCPDGEVLVEDYQLVPLLSSKDIELHIQPGKRLV